MSLSKKVVLTVSGYKISLSDSLQFYKNDQLKLIFEINKYGIDVASSFTHKTLMPLQPLTATLFIETPLGVDSIESANIEDNAVTFYLTSNQTQHIGTSRMQIKLTDDDGCQITLPAFTFEVQKNIYDEAIHITGVLMVDENGNMLSDENNNTINAYATTGSSKQIKDFTLKTGVSGQEDILIQDNGVTKRIKSSELIDSIDLTGYATETYVQNKIAEASLSGGEVDLSGYATKDELNKKADKTELHSHSNKTVLDGITSTKVTEWNNKSNFSGSYNDLINKPTIPTVDVTKSYVDTQLAKKSDISHNHDTVYSKINHTHTDMITSTLITKIEVVNALPEVELEGVLYLVKETTTEPEPTVTNLYPSQTTSTTTNGFTITFAERNVTIDGSKDTGSVLGQTEEFDMNLKANKTYYLQFTNVSGSFDDSKRVSENDGMICNVELKSYDSSHTPIILIDNVERDASGIYNKYTFTPKVDCIKFRLLIQAKKLMTFSNWTCSIVIAEEGV